MRRQETMPKSKVTHGAWHTADERLSQLPNAVEGQITEICRELAAETKRMHRLQEQADELRAVIRQWAADPSPSTDSAPINRAGRR